jgi:hypothetical protein
VRQLAAAPGLRKLACARRFAPAPPPPVDPAQIPTLDPRALVAMIVLLGAAAMTVLRRM